MIWERERGKEGEGGREKKGREGERREGKGEGRKEGEKEGGQEETGRDWEEGIPKPERWRGQTLTPAIGSNRPALVSPSEERWARNLLF